MSFVFLALSSAALGFGVAATRSRGIRGPWWVPAMVAAELAPWFLAGLGAMVVLSAAAGSTGGWAGTAGLVLSGFSAMLFVIAIAQSVRARPSIEAGVSEVLGSPVSLPPIRMRSLLRPYPPLAGRFRVDTLSYGPHERNVVDRIRQHDARSPAPVLVHIHGGGWWRGRPGRQARPLIHRMARAGWVVLAPTYRLSPEATFPDHLEDIRTLLRWARENASGLGVDPGFIAIAGGSAGGQLAALAAMADGSDVPGDDAFPQLAIPIYGVHDLFGDDGVSAKWPYLQTQVLKSDPFTDREAWLQASPIHRATLSRSPFLVIHGAADSVVDASESGRLVEALRAAGGPPVGHISVPSANHGFDFFASIRALLLAEGIGIALETLYERLSQRMGDEA
jgi:acetyl esterase/lipase